MENESEFNQWQARKLKFRPGVATLIADKDNRIPMGRRKSTAHDDGLWCLPGGGLEWGEDFASASERETLEECGLKILYKGQICSHTYYNVPFDSYHLTIYTMGELIDVENNVLVNAEPDKFYEWQWFAPEDIPFKDLAFPCTVPAVQRFLKVLANKELLITPDWSGE